MRGEHQAALQHFGHDLRRAGIEQPVELAVVERAHDHRQFRTQRVHVMQDLERGGRVRERDHHRARLGETGGDERLLAAGVAVHDGRAVAGRLAHALADRIERDERNLLGLEQPGEVLAAAAEPADDHVILARHRGRGDPRDLRRAREPVVGGGPAHERLREMDQERRRQHRQHHRRQHDAARSARARCAGRPRAPAAPARTRPPARDRSRCAATCRATRRKSATARRSARASRRRARRAAAAPRGCCGRRPKIERHPDGDEEEPQQHVAERLDVLLDLVAVFGLGDQHAGQERAQRERQPGELASAPRARA